MASIPVRGATLAWALADAGISIDDAAEKLKVSSDKIVAWTEETSQPSTTQTRLLAKLVGRSPQFLLLDTPPAASVVPTSFRRPTSLTNAPLSQTEIRSIRDAARTQRLLTWIAERDGSGPVAIPTATLDENPNELAEQLRSWLGWSTAKQEESSSSSASTKRLRRVLEDAGIAVLHFSMEEKGYRGFSLSDDRAPIIAANTKQRTEARAFTYAHELAHLVLDDSEVCDLRPSNPTERWCDIFAGAFLLERRALTEYVNKKFGGFVDTLDALKTVANHFRISMSATAIRLQDLGLGAPDLYQKLDRTFDLGKAKGGGGGGDPLDRTKKRYLAYGSHVTRTVEAAVSAGSLQRTDALSYFKVSAGEYGGLTALVEQEA